MIHENFDLHWKAMRETMEKQLNAEKKLAEVRDAWNGLISYLADNNGPERPKGVLDVVDSTYFKKIRKILQ